MSEIWNEPSISRELLDQLAIKNSSIFDFEKALEQKDEIVPQVEMILAQHHS